MNECIECGDEPRVHQRRLGRRCLAAAEAARRRARMETIQHEPCAKCDQPRYVSPSQVSSYCREHHLAIRREIRIRAEYGLTVQEYDTMLAGGCAICGSHKRLVLDHDHADGRNRGALCDDCNLGLGRFHDDPGLLRAAALYLE